VLIVRVLREHFFLGRVLINRDCSAIAGLPHDAQAIFRRRRHQPRRPPPANIRPGSPAPAMGPGTTSTAFDRALTAKSTSPPTTPGNGDWKPGGVRSCKVPSSSKLVRPEGQLVIVQKFPGGGDIPLSVSDWNVARNPTV